MPSNENDQAPKDLDIDSWLDDEATDSEPQSPEGASAPEDEDAPEGPEAKDPGPAPEPKAESKPKRTTKPKPKRNASDSNMATILGKQEQVMLQINEMENPPPGGVSVFINGYGFQIQPGHWVKVPKAVIEVLENAVETKASVADGRIIGHRTVPRYSFQVKPVKG